MSYIQSQSTEANKMAPPHQRLSNMTFKHQRNVMAWLLNKHPNVINGHLSYVSDMDLMHFISKFNPSQIDEAHYAVQATYNVGERYYKKGRPYGAKNRTPREMKAEMLDDKSTIDVLKELEDDEEDRGSVKPVENQFIQPSNQPTIDASKMRQEIDKMIAEKFEKFINATDKDIALIRADIHKQIVDTFEAKSKELNDLADKLRPNVIELKQPDPLPNINLGIQHKNFEKLLKICNARLPNGHHNNVWIYGPAGTGKSTAAENVAKAFNREFFCDGKLADKAEILGYNDANSNYKPTNFRKAFENGGVYLADEVDGWFPDAVIALNGALANGMCAFPDKIVKRHPNFIFLAAANTTGTGGTIEYVGRFQQDAAFNDRFVFLDWPIDEALEDAICPNKEWLARVRHVRARVLSSGIKGHLITPRASLFGASLLAADIAWSDVEAMTLKKGLTFDQWAKVN